MKYLLLVLLSAGLVLFWSCKAKMAPATDVKPFDEGQMEKMWNAIDSLERKGLLSSALAEVQRIKQSALVSKDAGHLFRAIMHENRYLIQLEEDAALKALERGEEELSGYPEPVKSVMHSLMAEWYANYLRGHLWEMRNRTEYEGPAGSDIRTWGMRHFIDKIHEHYTSSVQWEGLKTAGIKTFELLLTEDQKTDQLRPTLYDILMHRALDFFTGNETWLTTPSYDYVLNDPLALSPASSFVKHSFAAEDSLSSAWLSLRWFQDLLRFRLSDESIGSALLDADLKRLQYVYGLLVLDKKDSLYLDALVQLRDVYKNNEESSLVDYYRAEWLVTKAAQWQNDQESTYRYAYNQAMEICSSAMAAFPEAYGARLCSSLVQQIESKSLSASIESVNLPDEDLLAKLDYRNLDRVHLKIVRLPQSPRRWKGESWDGEEVLKKLNQLPAVKDWEQLLDNGNDHQLHSTEIGLPGLPVGHYALLVSEGKDFNEKKSTTGTIMFTVSTLAYWYLDDRSQDQRAAVLHRANGLPLPGVKVEFISSQYSQALRQQEEVKLGETVSNENGWVDVPAQPNKVIALRLTKGEDELFLDDSYYTYFSSGKATRNPATLFFSDRSIYRPGQKMYFKGYAVVFDEERLPSIVTNKKIDVVLYDVNGQEVAKQSLHTNEYGTFFGHFDLPAGSLTGQMSLSSSHGASRHYFRVEEYKRPKFEITFDTIRETIRLDQEVMVRAVARDYAGSALSGAQANYRVERVSYRPWWYWHSYRPGIEDRQVLKTGKAITGEDGSVDIAFTAKPKPGSDPDIMYRFEVILFVTDITGESHESSRTLVLNRQGYQVEIGLKEKVPVQEVKEIRVSATNSDGAKVSISGEVQVSLLNGPAQHKRDRLWAAPDIQGMSDQEYTTRFAHYFLPGMEHMSSWSTREVKGKRTIEVNGENEVDISMLINAPGYYKLDWSWKDEQGKELKIVQYTMVFVPGELLPGHETSQVAYDVQDYLPGDSVILSVLTGLATPPKTIRLVEHRTRKDRPVWSNMDALSRQPVILNEEDRGGVYVHHLTAYNNRFYKEMHFIRVPWNNKELNISLKTWRDKMEPGDEETWTLTVEGDKHEKVSAELVLSMYDASLDAFVPHEWHMELYPVTSARNIIHATAPVAAQYWGLVYHWDDTYIEVPVRQYRQVNTYGYYPEGGYYPWRGGVKKNRGEGGELMMQASESMPAPEAARLEDAAESAPSSLPGDDVEKSHQANTPQLRSLLDETVFFYPRMNTDEQGRLTFSFKMKEGLTRWKFQALGHTKELAYGYMQAEVVTQKKLMVFPNPPRFFREGDTIAFQAKVTSMSDEELTGKSMLRIIDAFTGEDVSGAWGLVDGEKAFHVGNKSSSSVNWMLGVPKDWYRPVKYQVSATAGTFSDGEESLLPVVTNRVLITETLPLPVKANETRTFVFKSMLEHKSGTSANHQYVVEMTTSPAWYAVQALPYLMEYPHECAEQVFSRLYANALASHIAFSYPAIRKVYDAWRLTEDDALLSNLEKNKDLKSAMLEETPWVRDAMGESQQKKDIALLFDPNRLTNERKQALAKLQDLQMASGGFPWFPGGRDNWYITQYILEGFGHLDKLEVPLNDPAVADITGKAIPYLDSRMIEWYDALKKLEAEGKLKMEDHQVGSLQVHYLYTRSFFQEIEHPAKLDEVSAYLRTQVEKYWLKHGLYDQGLIALGTLRTWPAYSLPKEILASLRERTILHEELGRYWKLSPGYHWSESAIEMQSLMIELFQDMGVPQAEVDELRVWLLRQKQTTQWKSTKATASAIYALLIHPDTWLQSVGMVNVSIGGKEVIGNATSAEGGTGYVRKAWGKDDIKPEWSSVTVSNPNAHIAWGSAYWQYWEDIDKVKSGVDNNPLNVTRSLLMVNLTDRGEVTVLAPHTQLIVGDKLIVRLTIETDRQMDFVHLKDLRASGFEPKDVLSGYRWSGSIGYYQSTRDLATHFFIDNLPRGKHVIEYGVTVAQAGTYSEGLATLQCMYAPEFGSHSSGRKVHATGN